MNLLKCPFCGEEIENDSFYCDQCGEELKVCPSGHGFKKGKICSECGTKLVEAKNAAGNQPQPAAATPPPSQAQAQATNVRPQSTITMPPVEVENVSPKQAEAVEKTVRPAAEPKYLVSTALNARLELKNGAIIGRKTGDYVNVFGNQGYVSGTHARVQKNAAGAWEIVDLDSSNGTFLNGQKLVPNQPAAFKIGDTIMFYDLKFVSE
jgi:hypothetical protein